MPTCPICGSSSGTRIKHASDATIDRLRQEAGDTAPYYWSLCSVCGNAFPSTAPKPAVLEALWRTNRTVEASSADKAWQQRVAMARLAARRSYATFAPLHTGKPGRMLDIACGLGETVALFGRHGWRAEGIDIDPQTKRFHDTLGITSRIGRIEASDVTGPYDLIHIAHAIYFISEPRQFLERVRALLGPQGIFAVVISDLLASTDNSKPSYWHTFYPCAASMKAALERAGFAPIVTRKWGGSILIAARPAEPHARMPATRTIAAMWATKTLRYNLLGRPNLALRGLAKRVLRRGSF